MLGEREREGAKCAQKVVVADEYWARVGKWVVARFGRVEQGVMERGVEDVGVER